MQQSIESYIKSLVRDAIGGLELQKDRRIYVVANWKMNKMIAETAEFFQELKGSEDVSVVVCPPSQLLYPAHLLIKQLKRPVSLGAQNVHYAEKGAFTGEVSAAMLKDVGCEYVIIGHSERRQYAGEDNEMVRNKTSQAIETGLVPIICVGETLEQKNLGQTEQVLRTQLLGGLKDIDLSDFIIAYEPVWAIGTGQSATAEQAQQTHSFIRSVLRDVNGDKADAISILYGGSVSEKNAAEFSRMADIDGVLVGGASLNAQTFTKIIDVFAKGEQ
jgi:triosephosphate isomerase